MKQILGIAKTELQVLFFSPIAWFILIVFMVQSSLSYFGTVGSMAATMHDGRGLSDVTYGLLVQYGMTSTLFPQVLGTLFYYIPLLTMGVMSRELSSGSIKLLYASPVTNAQIVLGKFLSVAFYGLFMVVLLLLLVMQGAWIVGANFDWGFVPVSLLGVFLVICAYGAVGVFMSSITSYQMVAMLSTLVALTFFNYVGTFGQDISFVRDITYWFSINGRAMLFAKGVFCSEDLLYFLTVIFLFLSLSIIRLVSQRENISRVAILGKYALTFGIVVLVAFVSSRPVMKFYYDATRFERHTLTETSQDIIAQLEGDYTITTYANIFETFPIVSKAYPRSELDDINKLLSPYTRFKKDLKLKYKYYAAPTGGTYDYYRQFMKNASFDEIVEEQLERLEISEKRLTPLDEIIKMEPLVEQEDFRTIKVIESPSGEKVIIRYFNDITVVPTEAEISAAFKRLITTNYPKVAFVSGHGERSIYNDGDMSYSMFTSKAVRSSLYNQGYDVTEITLDKPVADDISTIVIADPRVAFTEVELANYNSFVARGGNIVILGEPARKDNIDVLISPFGYKMADGVLVKPRAGSRADLIAQKPTLVGRGLSYFMNNFAKDGITKISTPSATYLEQIAETDYNETIVMTSDGSMGDLWNELETRNFEEQEPTRNEEIGEVVIRREPMAVALDKEVGGKTQKIMIISDADLFSNQEMAVYPHSGIRADNASFVTAVFEWMSDGVSPIDMRRKEPTDTSVDITIEGAKLVKGFYMWGIPLVMLIFAMVISIRRRSR